MSSAADKDEKKAADSEIIAREAEMIARILAGERELFHQLIRPYERGLYVAAYSIVQHEADAEDIAQEAVIKAYKGLKHFRGDAKFSTWLMAITLNEARSRYRQTKGDHIESLEMARRRRATTRPRYSRTGAIFLPSNWSARSCGRRCRKRSRNSRQSTARS